MISDLPMPLIYVTFFLFAFYAAYSSNDAVDAGILEHTEFYAQHMKGRTITGHPFYILADEFDECTAMTLDEFWQARKGSQSSSFASQWTAMRIIDRPETSYTINVAGNMVLANADWVEQLRKLDSASAIREKMEVFGESWTHAQNVIRRCHTWDSYFWVVMGCLLIIAQIASIIEMCGQD